MSEGAAFSVLLIRQLSRAQPMALLYMGDSLFHGPRTLLSSMPSSRKWGPGQDVWPGAGGGEVGGWGGGNENPASSCVKLRRTILRFPPMGPGQGGNFHSPLSTCHMITFLANVFNKTRPFPGPSNISNPVTTLNKPFHLFHAYTQGVKHHQRKAWNQGQRLLSKLPDLDHK